MDIVNLKYDGDVQERVSRDNDTHCLELRKEDWAEEKDAVRYFGKNGLLPQAFQILYPSNLQNAMTFYFHTCAHVTVA